MSRNRNHPGNRDRHEPSGGHAILVGRPDHDMRATAAPPTLREGQVRCPVCRNATSLTPRGYLRQHRDLFGDTCTNKATGERVPFVAPPVVLPRVRTGPVRDPANTPERYKRPPGESRLDVGSECRDCGKWLPGERILCGRCYVRRDASR